MKCLLLMQHRRYFDWSVIASEIGKFITVELAIFILNKSIHAQYCDTSQLILHAHQGTQVTAIDFTSLFEIWRIKQCMGRAGTPYENLLIDKKVMCSG